uniref:F-box associated beta-propeller type 3 domain-containing protein n=1 Tax=Aegilops tauschii TaxID=37682 RepID=M8CR60_AEGTA
MYLVGHVPATGEHKVLHITDVRGKQACEVFTIGAAGRNNGHQCQRWRPAQSPPMRVDSIPRRRAVVNGVAYFLPSHLNGRCLLDYDSVAAFDLEKEEWRPAPIRGPLSSERPGHCDQLLCFSLAELNGHLVMVHHNNLRKTVDMYSLSPTEGVEWSMGPSLRLDSVLDRNRKGETLVQPLMELDDRRIALFVPGTQHNVVRVYDPRKETRTDVMEMPRGHIIVGCYKGSLLPFHGMGEARFHGLSVFVAMRFSSPLS